MEHALSNRRLIYCLFIGRSKKRYLLNKNSHINRTQSSCHIVLQKDERRWKEKQAQLSKLRVRSESERARSYGTEGGQSGEGRKHIFD
jgi:hypothetical protein